MTWAPLPIGTVESPPGFGKRRNRSAFQFRDPSLGQKRAHVFADAASNLDIEARISGNFKAVARADRTRLLAAIDPYLTFSSNNFHALGQLRAEMEFAGIYQANGFFAPIREKQGVTRHFAVEIDIGFGNRGHIYKFRCHGIHFEKAGYPQALAPGKN
jgi:hypothetical protein